MLLLTLPHAFIILLLAYRICQKSQSLKKYFLTGLMLKIAAGIFIGLLYNYYYGYGDTLVYFQKGSDLADLAYSHVKGYWQYLFNTSDAMDYYTSGYENRPRALFFLKIVSLFCIITCKNYWITTIYLSVLSYFAVWKLVRTLISHFGHPAPILFSFLFVPSVVLWSSGIIKEAVSMLAICLFADAFIRLMACKDYRARHWVGLLLSAVVLWQIKYYYAAILFLFGGAAAITIVLMAYWKRLSTSAWQTGVVFGVCTLALAAGVTFLHPNFDPATLPEVVVTNYNAYERLSDSDDYIHYTDMSPTWKSLLRNAPFALFSGLFRPVIGQSAEPLKILCGLENGLLLFLTASAFFTLPARLSPRRLLLASTVVLITVVLITFLSLSAPNYGTLARYKAGILPFFVLVCTYHNPYIRKIFRVAG